MIHKCYNLKIRVVRVFFKKTIAVLLRHYVITCNRGLAIIATCLLIEICKLLQLTQIGQKTYLPHNFFIHSNKLKTKIKI